MADLKKVAFFHGKAANIVAQIEAGNIKAGIEAALTWGSI